MRSARRQNLPRWQRHKRGHRGSYGVNAACVRLAVTRRLAASEAHSQPRPGPRHSRHRRGRGERCARWGCVTHAPRRPLRCCGAGSLCAGGGSLGGGASGGRGARRPLCNCRPRPRCALTRRRRDTGCGGCTAAGRGERFAAGEGGSTVGSRCANVGCSAGPVACVFVHIPHLHLHGAGSVVGDHPGAVPVRGGAAFGCWSLGSHLPTGIPLLLPCLLTRGSASCASWSTSRGR